MNDSIWKLASVGGLILSVIALGAHYSRSDPYGDLGGRPRTLKATSVEIVDLHGRPIAELGGALGGLLILRDENGFGRVMITADKNGGGVNILSAALKTLVSLGEGGSGGLVQVNDSAGKPASMLSFSTDGKPIVQVCNPRGGPAAYMVVEQGGNGLLGAWDLSGQGKSIAPVAAEPSGPAEPLAWHSVLSDVYHTNPLCTTGNNIEVENRRLGTGGKQLCQECARLNKKAP